MAWSPARWEELLVRWEARLLAWEATPAVASGSLRQAPATETDIVGLEGRLGCTLAPSYRSFLETTDGVPADLSGWSSEPLDDPTFHGFLPARLVTTVPRISAAEVMVWVVPECWLSSTPFAPAIELASYLSRTGSEDEALVGHLLHSIAVRGPSPSGNVRLNPLVVDADGEWEAWLDTRRFRCFGELMESVVAELAPQASSPSSDGAMAVSAVDHLVARAAAADPTALEELERSARIGAPIERPTALHAIGTSSSHIVADLAVQLMRAHPDDPVIVGNLVTTLSSWRNRPGAEAAIRLALRGEGGGSVASQVVHWWPELVESEYAWNGDPVFLSHLLAVCRPGALTASLAALEDPSLGTVAQGLVISTLAGHVRQPDPPDVAAILRLIDRPGIELIHLAQVLLDWGAETDALRLLERHLTEGHRAPPAEAAYIDFADHHVAAAAPILARALDRNPTRELLRAVAFLDHPAAVRAVAEQLDGPLHDNAMLALEQLAADEACIAHSAAREVLAQRAAAGSLASARALGRCGDVRALGPLLAALTTDHLSATWGLAELCQEEALSLLSGIAAEDADDDTAVAAAYGLVRAYVRGMIGDEDLHAAIAGIAARAAAGCRPLAHQWRRAANGCSAGRTDDV